MKRTLLLTICLMSAIVSARAQSKVPDCDTSKFLFSFIEQPCKIKVFKDGKFIGYTEKSYHNTLTSATSFAYTGPPINALGNYRTINSYKWVMLCYPDLPQWWIDNPAETKDKYIIHINRKQLKWLNDSTAVYSNPKTK